MIIGRAPVQMQMPMPMMPAQAPMMAAPRQGFPGGQPKPGQNMQALPVPLLQPVRPQASAQAPATPALKTAARAPAARPQPVFRAQNDDEAPAPRPEPVRLAVSLPPPEALGVRPPEVDAPAAGVDPARLRQLGATALRLDRLPSGQYRVLFSLPGDQTGQARVAEFDDAAQAAALFTALQQPELSARR